MILPVPATKGGAIETIIENLLMNNNQIEIDCFSIGKKKSVLRINEKNCIFYLKRNPLLTIIDKFTNIIFLFIYKCKMSKVFLKQDHLYKYMSKNVKTEDYDFIIFEGGHFTLSRYFLKKTNISKLVYHLHFTYKGKHLNEFYGKVLVVSSFLKKMIIKNNLFSDENVKVLRNVIDEKKYKIDIDEYSITKLRAELGIGSSKIILYVGRIIPEKGIQNLIEAIKKIKKNKISLIIIGSSSFGLVLRKTKFERYIYNQIKSVDNIKYLGYISNNELYKFYKIADLFVMPSIWDEAAGLVNLESIACGTPVLTTNKGGISEYLDDRISVKIEVDSNFTDSLKKHIETILDNEEKYQKMKEYILSFAQPTYEQYSYDFYVILNEWKCERG
jgi:glycosyltransferase involved in cell wall biosynthesis